MPDNLQGFFSLCTLLLQDSNLECEYITFSSLERQGVVYMVGYLTLLKKLWIGKIWECKVYELSRHSWRKLIARRKCYNRCWKWWTPQRKGSHSWHGLYECTLGDGQWAAGTGTDVGFNREWTELIITIQCCPFWLQNEREEGGIEGKEVRRRKERGEEGRIGEKEGER